VHSALGQLTIAVTADVHSPKYLDLYSKALKALSMKPDLFIWAGDMVNKNDIGSLKPVIDVTYNVLGNVEIIGIFGNEEYRGYEDRYKKLYSGIKWVNDEYIILERKGLRIGVIGTRGALDKPTPWQAKNIPGIEEYYKNLPSKIKDLALSIRNKVDQLILVSHYGVTYKNLYGEPRRIWPYLASKAMEKIIDPRLFNIVVHGHAHNSVYERIIINSVPVYNVSLPARKKIMLIKISLGILGFLR